MLSPFRYHAPTSLEAASAALVRLGDDARVYAGGVWLLLQIREGAARPGHLVDIKRLGLDRIEWDGRLLRIGAAVTHRRVAADPLVRERIPILAGAAAHIGNVRVRAQGTIGGNLCFADPHGDPAPALLVHDAAVTLYGPSGVREVPLEAFLEGTYRVGLRRGEILTEVVAAPLPPGWGHAYQRFELLYQPTLNVAAAVHRDGERLAAVRLAVGCIGPKALRLRDLERRLTGLTVAEAGRLIRSARNDLVRWLTPVDDLQGSADYKVHLAGVLLARALEGAAS